MTATPKPAKVPKQKQIIKVKQLAARGIKFEDGRTGEVWFIEPTEKKDEFPGRYFRIKTFRPGQKPQKIVFTEEMAGQIVQMIGQCINESYGNGQRALRKQSRKGGGK